MKKIILVAAGLSVVGGIIGYGYLLLTDEPGARDQVSLKSDSITPRAEKQLPPRDMRQRPTEQQVPIQPSSSGTSEQKQQIEKEPTTSVTLLDDTSSTLASPIKVATSDKSQYFIFGQPNGQNSKTVKKIIFSLPGHGSTAEQDYEAWKPHIKNSTYALASLNWWDGDGEKLTDYYAPDEVLSQIKGFLATYGYADKDFVVLEGFSRGSANTYPVKGYDAVSGSPAIDAVISASGKYQSDFPLAPEQMKTEKLFSGVPWILVCGRKDDNPTRDGCEGMSETKTYLTGQGANVLGLLEDPNGGHGAFHQSPLNLPEKALVLFGALIQ